MNKELVEKIEKLSFFSMAFSNVDERRMMPLAEGVMEFTREEIIAVCDDLFSFVIYGLAKSNQQTEILSFLEEYHLSKRITYNFGKDFQCNFQYKRGTTSTIRFIRFANYYMEKFEKNFTDTPFEAGNIFLKFQINDKQETMNVLEKTKLKAKENDNVI